MPIKLPKGFARRKSSGNALEEVENPPQSSFKVFERPSADKKSSSDGNLMSKRLSEGQPLYSPSEDDDSNIFAASENHHSRNSYDALPTTLFYYQGTNDRGAKVHTKEILRPAFLSLHAGQQTERLRLKLSPRIRGTCTRYQFLLSLVHFGQPGEHFLSVGDFRKLRLRFRNLNHPFLDPQETEL